MQPRRPRRALAARTLGRQGNSSAPTGAFACCGQVSNSIVHHIPEPIAVFVEMVRVVRPGGVLFVRDLLRPDDEPTLRNLVELYAAGANARISGRCLPISLHARRCRWWKCNRWWRPSASTRRPCGRRRTGTGRGPHASRPSLTRKRSVQHSSLTRQARTAYQWASRLRSAVVRLGPGSSSRHGPQPQHHSAFPLSRFVEVGCGNRFGNTVTLPANGSPGPNVFPLVNRCRNVFKCI